MITYCVTREFVLNGENGSQVRLYRDTVWNSSTSHGGGTISFRLDITGKRLKKNDTEPRTWEFVLAGDELDSIVTAIQELCSARPAPGALDASQIREDFIQVFDWMQVGFVKRSGGVNKGFIEFSKGVKRIRLELSEVGALHDFAYDLNKARSAQ